MTDSGLRPRRGAHRAPRRPLVRVAPVVGAVAILAIAIGLVRTLGSEEGPVTANPADPTTTASAPAPSAAPPAAPPSAPSTPTTSAAPTDQPPIAGNGTDVPARNRFEVVVLNQTRRAGLAATVAETLRSDGWNVASIGNFGGTVAETAVYFPPGGEAAATELASRLPVTPTVRPVFPALDAERLTVILTDNFPVTP